MMGRFEAIRPTVAKPLLLRNDGDADGGAESNELTLDVTEEKGNPDNPRNDGDLDAGDDEGAVEP